MWCQASKQRFLTYDDIEKLEYFAKSKQWWDSIGILAVVIGRIGLTDEIVDKVMKAWAHDDNIWPARAAMRSSPTMSRAPIRALEPIPIRLGSLAQQGRRNFPC